MRDAYMKHHQALFPAKAKYHVDDVLDLVQGDLYSPITLTTPDGCRYFLLSIDDASRFMWLALLASS